MGRLTTGGLQSLRYNAESKTWLTKSDALKASVQAPGKPEPAKTPLCDGDGLYLHLTPGGKAVWRIEYRFKNTRKSYTAGQFTGAEDGLSLAEAREVVTQVKRWIREGKDPSQEKRKDRGTGEKFRDVAMEFFSRKTTELNPKYRQSVLRRLEIHVFPKIGKMSLTEIGISDLLRTYKSVEKKGVPETAHRIAGLVDRIFEYSRLTGRIDVNPAARLSAALKAVPHGHRPAILDPEKIGELLRRIETYPGSDAMKNLLRIEPYVFLRAREIRLACWSEIDFEKAIWTIPAEHMKMKRDHIVPLADQVLMLLRSFPHDSDFIFPGRGGGPLSPSGVCSSTQYLGYAQDEMCVHGFRSIASTILNEHGWRPDVIEMQLAHAPKNAVRAAYNRACYLPERKTMMQWYADFLDAARGNGLDAFLEDRGHDGFSVV